MPRNLGYSYAYLGGDGITGDHFLSYVLAILSKLFKLK